MREMEEGKNVDNLTLSNFLKVSNVSIIYVVVNKIILIYLYYSNIIWEFKIV